MIGRLTTVSLLTPSGDAIRTTVIVESGFGCGFPERRSELPIFRLGRTEGLRQRRLKTATRGLSSFVTIIALSVLALTLMEGALARVRVLRLESLLESSCFVVGWWGRLLLLCLFIIRFD